MPWLAGGSNRAIYLEFSGAGCRRLLSQDCAELPLALPQKYQIPLY